MGEVLPKKYYRYRSRFNSLRFSGFTLVELLVVIFITGLLVNIGYGSYREYARNQLIVGATEQLRGHLRLAQQLSTSGNKPATGVCSTQVLTGYRLNPAAASTTDYEIHALCAGGLNQLISTYTLRDRYPGVTFNAFSPVTFNNLGRGVASGVTITLTSGSATRQIMITTGGQINAN